MSITLYRPRQGRSPWRTALDLIRHHHALSQTRQSLAQLTTDQLRDIGVSAEAAREEAARPFWDAPTHWSAR